MNIAGIGTAKRVVGKDGSPAPLEDFERVVRINLVGTYNVVRLTAARIAKLAGAGGRRARRDALHGLGGRLRRPGGPGGLLPPARAASSA
jgi:NAD(P)-dependent dehydrogenase (short-subunit alcohol dehydrogenase family)